MSQLPNHVYYPTLAHMSTVKLERTVLNVMFTHFGAPLVRVPVWYAEKWFRFSPLAQLSFVLETQSKMVQTKLVLRVICIVQPS
uniref:Uncharacterized protein n=1 Tax=Globisporangium ultimum (strain ATCC 200006 / CBS 805.95 / DAOM BR144) TaxID=431595 RepID=K3X1E5_GLOUD